MTNYDRDDFEGHDHEYQPFILSGSNFTYEVEKCWICGKVEGE